MGKSSKETYGAVGSRNCLDFEPEKLVIVTDEKHPLYDERVHLPVDEALVLNIMHHGVLEPVLISTNEIRQADTPLVRARKMQRAAGRGHSDEQIATLFGVGVGTVRNYLGVLEASAPVRNALDAETITVSDACRIAKLPREEQETQLAEFVQRAPKLPGKRRKRGTLKRATSDEPKASAPTSGGKLSRSRADVETLLERFRVDERIRENDRMPAVAMLEWVLGDDTAIDFAGLAVEDLGAETDESSIDDSAESQRSATESEAAEPAAAQ